MIKFIKTPHHFKNLDDETEGITVSIETNGQTLGEISEAYNKFLSACGFQVLYEDEDVYHLKDLTLEELEDFTKQERLNIDTDEDEE